MNLRPITRAEAREIDRLSAEAGLATIVLMENAGRGAAELLRNRGSRVAIVCGPGNNGGDGAVAARHLDAWGVSVIVAWTASDDKIAGDAAVQRRILSASGIEQVDTPEIDRLASLLAGSDWIIDGLFGTGLSRPVEGYPRAVIEAMNASNRPILALDLPSGMDADTGETLGIAVRATLTATFVAPKLGFGHPDAAKLTGTVEVIEIGAPRTILKDM